MEKNELLETNVGVLITKFNEFKTTVKDLIQGMSGETCKNLGSNYRFILDTCYYFEKSKSQYDEAKQNCQGKFGSNTDAKLMEPKTMERFEKIRKLAKTILERGAEILTGFEKNDNAGTDVRHTSDMSRALIKPWQGNGDTDDHAQPYLRFMAHSNMWNDGDNDMGGQGFHSICESY